ncbi:MAG: NAD(P)H-dependent oxidoreductase subunit E [Methyloprofundus sp.]|nr:NAD(P)H-dependent oxidoreductase subunit E [Methyloprofundus sp.]
MQSFIQAVINKYEASPVRLLHILRDTQAKFQHISPEAIEIIAAGLTIPRTQIISVVEFYNFLHLTPRGKYDILISDSITDHMLGKQNLMHYFASQLNVTIGKVRADGLVSLDNTSCTGMCDQGPAGLVNGYALTHLDRPRIDAITQLIEQAIPIQQWPAEFFTVNDNIHQAGLLLQAPITKGEALKARYQRGLTETLTEIDISGLRGRGGAGFKTAMKWRFCSEEAESERYVVCNADEGEPGTFKDRVLLNSYAHQVFEGMTVCASIIGSEQGFLYLRGEYLHLYEKLQAILTERRAAGLLGTNILAQGLNFDIEIRLGLGAYICGEESALIESLEGKCGIPRNRPPYPVSQGYLNKPTVVNNVETFMAAAKITVVGGQWFADVGTEKSDGTKILSISGDCSKPGIYEYPFGTSIRQVLHDCGAHNVFGVQVGGPSGTFISAQELDRVLAFEDLATGGSFIIFNHSRNVLDMVKNFTHFFAHESCGFCTPCRVGTSLLKKQLDKIVEGHGSAGDVAALEALSRLVNNNSHCGLGQTAANPILSTLQRYPELYEKQLKQISYEPGFDLDASLATARRLANRDDAGAHLAQVEED